MTKWKKEEKISSMHFLGNRSFSQYLKDLSVIHFSSLLNCSLGPERKTQTPKKFHRNKGADTSSKICTQKREGESPDKFGLSLTFDCLVDTDQYAFRLFSSLFVALRKFTLAIIIPCSPF